MDSHHLWCITFATLLSCACLLQPAAGKCKGRWAIHACFGGNGKRSDPRHFVTERGDNLLRQLLLREPVTERRPLRNTISPFGDDLSERNTQVMDVEIEKLNNILTRLILQRKLRQSAEGLD